MTNLLEFETQEDIDKLSAELHKLLVKRHPSDFPKTRGLLKKLDEKAERVEDWRK